MKTNIKYFISALLMFSLAMPLFLTGCGTEGADTQTTAQSTTTESNAPDEPEEEEGGVDLVLFIGQSNMAGRGVARDATKVEKGHAYEFRAISDPTKLYPLTEPFGAAENNAASGVTENKKSGSMVSAFCESYYQATGRPIVAVSCSKGGEKISFFDSSSKVYKDACDRVNAAKAFLQSEYDAGKTELKVNGVYVVWLQGESDGDAATSAAVYKRTLDRIVKGFRSDIGCDRFFVIPIGTYNGSDSARIANYAAIRQAQIDYCEGSANATVISLSLTGLHTHGYMKDEFHFNQAGYNIIGKDAGENMAYFVINGEKPACKEYTE